MTLPRHSRLLQYFHRGRGVPSRFSLPRAALLAAIVVAGSESDKVVSPIALRGPARNVDASTATMTLELTFNDAVLRDLGVSFAASCPFTLYRDRTPDNGYGAYVTSICGSQAVVLAGQATGTHTYELRYNGQPATAYGQDIVSSVTTTLLAGESFTQNFELHGAMALLTGTLAINGQLPATNDLFCSRGQYQVAPCVQPNPTTGAFAFVDLAGARQLGVRGFSSSVTVAGPISVTLVPGETRDLGHLDVPVGSMTMDLQYGGVSLQTQGITFTQYCYMILYFDPPTDPNAGSPSQGICQQPNTLDVLPADGPHTYQLRFSPPRPSESAAIVSTATVSLTPGNTTTQPFELNGAMGLVTGRLLDRGAVPAANSYLVCNSSQGYSGPCTRPDPTTGVFKLLDLSGSRTATIRKISEYVGGQPLSYTIVTGQTTDLGDVAILSTSVTIQPTYNGKLLKDIGANYQQFCMFQLYRDATTSSPYGTFVNSLCPGQRELVVSSLTPGQHTFDLRYLGPSASRYSSQPIVSSVTVNVVDGTATTQAMELGGTMGLVSGELTVNGHAPGSGYLICNGSFDYYSPCVETDATTGSFGILDVAGARLGIVRTYSSFAPSSSFGYTVVAGTTTIVGTTTGGVAGTTPEGTHVSVTPVDAATGTTPATLAFSQVTSAGLTTVSTSPTGPTPPTGTKLGRPTFYYNIATSAAFNGTITLCIHYAAGSFSDPTRAQLLHGDGKGGWTDITTSRDPANNVICGETSSLSPFVIVEPANRPPVAMAGGPYSSDEGSELAFNGSGSSDPDGDLLSYAWTFGDGGTATGPTPRHVYADNGSYAVSLTVTDPGGLTSTSTATATVANVRPRVSIGSDATIVSGQSYAATGSFSDPGTLDAPWSYTLAFGEGLAVNGTTRDQSAAIAGTHQYFRAGTYRVGLTVTDKDGGAGSAALSLSVQRLAVGSLVFPFLSSLPHVPVTYDPLTPAHSTPVVVALLGSASFTVADPSTRSPLVDVASLRLGRTPVALVVGRPLVAAVDVNGDGILDLVITFATDKLVANGDLSATLSTPQSVALTGDHHDGRQFSSTAQVTVRQKFADSDR